MQLKSILTPERTHWGIAGISKKRVFQTIAHLLADTIAQFSEEEIYEALLNREKLGTTALGHGIAIPHSRIDNCVKTTGALFKLEEGVDFDAPDQTPVDLVFVLLVPIEATDTHLEVLSELAGLFSQERFREQLRNAGSAEALFHTTLSAAEQLSDSSAA